MTTIPSLEILKQKQEELLLAEVAALFHDWQKCIDMTVASGWRNNPFLKSTKIQVWQQRGNLLRPGDFAQSLSAISVSLDNQSIDLKSLCQEGKDPSTAKQHSHFLVRILGECHGLAHVDKELEINEQTDKACDRISTAFGFEPIEPDELLGHLLSTVKPFLGNLTLPDDREKLLFSIQEVFSNAWGDTRRPINEVTLWDWGYAVAGLYKSAVASRSLNLDFSRWRLLRVNFDALALYSKAIKIADLLAYQNAVEDACQRVKTLVEEEYPLGNEVYRDTTGIYFTFPNLGLPADLAQEIRRLVEDVEPELAPRIAVTEGKEDATAQEQLKGILGKARSEALKDIEHPFDSANLTSCWQQLWETVNREKKWEVCPVCGLRPKEEHAEVCTHCEKRRESRLDTWFKNPSQTIWLGEIADHNDRLALLVGKFDLDDWLSGNVVQTMLVKAVENNPNECKPKNPSPARLRRVWETCQHFWERTVQQEILSAQLGKRGTRQHIIPSSTAAACGHRQLGKRGTRQHIIPNRTDWQPGLYNGKVNNKPIDLFWQPQAGVFLTISNLQAAGEFKAGDTILLERPETKQKSEFQIREIREAPTPFDRYQPFLALPASPDQFLAFVPAADALDIAQKIRSKYETQFGKVRNRLPLHLGVVYFERKMPLMAVLDAARAMLNAPLHSELWIVKSADGAGHVEFKNGIAWNVSTVMGDGKTEDLWYPYFELDGEPAAHHAYQFQHNGKTWVHVKNLQKDDKVQVFPSRFDFLWLDAASRRFQLAYDEDGRRFDRPSRPYYLEDLQRLEQIWKTFSKLKTTQIYQTLETIETRRERWNIPLGTQAENDEIFKVFRQFAADTLINAQWDWKTIPENQRKQLITAAVRGELADLAELHLSILKEKPEEKE